MTLTRRAFAAILAVLLALSFLAAPAETPADYDMSAPQNLSEGNLYADSALLVDAATGEVLFSKNSRVRMFPASTTKIMTLLLGLESGIPLDSRVTIPQEAADIAQGSSVVPVLPGDVMSFGDLLYGFMLSSGNDGANAVAVLTDGDIETFVAHMNARAAELGMEGTRYVNAHGYQDTGHYTTAQDLAILSREAMKNEDFRKIVATAKWTMSIERGGQTVTNEIVSRNSLLQSDLKYYYPECNGIKTGHHNKAGWCFVGSAERNGRSVICVVLHCAQENDKWYDAARLFEYGFTRYEDVAVQALLERVFSRFERVQLENADVADAESGSLLLILGPVEGGERTVPVVAGSEASLANAAEGLAQRVSIEWLRPLEAPVAEGEALGRLTATLADGSAISATLSAARAVQAVNRTPPAATAPLETVPASVDAVTPRETGHQDERKGGGLIVLVILAALLACCLVALALLKRAQRRRRRRRRRLR